MSAACVGCDVQSFPKKLAKTPSVRHIALMKTRRLWFLAGMLAAAAEAQPLKILDVGAPAFYCHFSPDCRVTYTEQTALFTPTNVDATCVLVSRSFPGRSLNTVGTYGYEYRLVLNNTGSGGTNFLTVNSLTLPCPAPQTFSYALRGGNQIWVVTAGGPGGVAPASVSLSDTNLVVEFNPPLVLATETNQSVGTYFFGLTSTNAPRLSTAVLAGSTQTGPEVPVPFRVELTARTP
jgi:hypothetical protein